MALATQCPHCRTTFRVAHDQLKLRAGLVRCGACKQIFNGIENLLRPEEFEPRPAPAPATPHSPSPSLAVDEPPSPPAPAASVAPAMEKESLPEAESPAVDVATQNHHESPVEERLDGRPAAQERADDPLLRMTLMDFAHARPQSADSKPEESPPSQEAQPDAVEQAIDDLNQRPWRQQNDADAQADADALDRVEASEYVEPAFVRQGRRKERLGRIMRIFMAAAFLPLAIGVLAQGTYVFRDQIAARFPQAKPLLVEACLQLGCQVALPARIEDMSIESSELQALGANASTFSLTVLLRNHGATEQTWPHIELTLNDANESPLLRRVFTPLEYLAAVPDAKKGLAARSEQSVRLFFELSQLKASGYRVYLFYP